MKRRETRAEADERIVAEAGPSWSNATTWDKPMLLGPHVTAMVREDLETNMARAERVASAAARILNRISKRRRRGRKA